MVGFANLDRPGAVFEYDYPIEIKDLNKKDRAIVFLVIDRELEARPDPSSRDEVVASILKRIKRIDYPLARKLSPEIIRNTIGVMNFDTAPGILELLET